MVKEPKFLIITGMHRSRTSLLGNMFRKSGLPFHENVVGATSSNPFGHFEDKELLDMHERILADNRAKWYRGIDKPLVVREERKREIARIVSERFENYGNLWGFKIPHTSLILDYFKSYKEARFVFVYRPPQEVISSLLRRMKHQLYWRLDAPYHFARAYAIYNERIASFAAENRERSYTLSSAAFLNNPSTVLSEISERFDLNLARLDQLDALIKPDILSAPRHQLERLLSEQLSKLPRVVRAYEAVKAVSDGGGATIDADE